jgi:hypothetical protein
MRTEELIQPKQRPDAAGVSPALVERVPPDWRLTDEHGRPVSLSLAGYVLHFGRTYKLMVAPFAEGGPVPEVRLSCRPTWVVAVDGPPTEQKHGRQFAGVSFKVRRQTSWLKFYYWLWEIYTDPIEFEASTPSLDKPDRRVVSPPVVARSRWLVSLIALAIVGAIFFALIQVAAKQCVDLVSAELTAAAPPDGWRISWGLIVSGAIISPVLAFGYVVYSLGARRRELMKEFRRRWPRVSL